jgi:cell division protein FtsI (penicillin-binding protein 3)
VSYNLPPVASDDTGIELQLPLEIPLSTAPRQGRPQIGLPTGTTPMAVARNRMLLVSSLFAMAFLMVTVRLVDATLLNAPSTQITLNSAGEAVATASRADITDRNGDLLATSLPTQSLYAEPKRILDVVAAARALIDVLPSLKYEELLEKMTSGRQSIRIARSLTPDEVYRVNALGVPGFVFQTEMTRIYPAGASVVHAIGYTDVDGNGLSGLERGLDARLKQGGGAVATSLDLRLQHIMERELSNAIEEFRAVGGAGVVMDAWTGEILAAVSLPDFAPTDISTAGDEARFNRYALGVYELGSVMKVINTTAALESGRVNVNDFFDASHPLQIGRFSINDYHNEGRWLSVPEVFLYSSNIGAARMALEMGGAFQHEFLCKVGLCTALPLELGEVGHPLLPTRWPDVTVATVAFGHGISLTPLHLVRATATIMNGGHLVTPTFLAQPAPVTPQGPVVVSANTADMMRRIMRANVTSPEGSGSKAEASGYFVGGKTGTAEKTVGRRYSQDARLSSFIAAFPAYNPRYIIYAMIDEPRGTASTHGFATGGWVAAPMVGRVIAQMGPLYGMKPLAPDDADAVRALSLEVRTRRTESASY